MENTQPHERLTQARRALGLSQRAFALPLDTSQAAVQRWESGDVELTHIVLSAVEHIHKISNQWIKTGEGSMMVAPSDIAALNAELDYRPIIDGAASCGPGGEIADPGPSALRVPFRREFLQELLQECGAGSADDLYVVECSGESMRPTVHPGDLALINTTLDLRIQPKRSSLYLVRPDPASADARIKRIRLDADGQLWFFSDAPGFAPVAVDLDGLPLQSLILGRVCWIARSVVKDERLERNW